MVFWVLSLFCSVWLHVRMVSVPSSVMYNLCHQCTGTHYTVVKHSYFTFLLKKKLFSTFLNTWSSFSLPKWSVWFLSAYKFIFSGLLRFFGVLWLIFLFAITLQGYATIYQSNTNWCGITINITTVSIMPSLHLDKCGEGVLKGIACLDLVSHWCNWLKV